MTRIPATVALCLLLAGCAGNADNFISAKIDGKHLEFREFPTYVISGLGGRKEVLTISASKEGSQGRTAFEIDMELPGGELRTTGYSGKQLNASAPRPGYRVKDELTAQYTRGDGSGSYINDTDEHSPCGDFVVRITSLDARRVAGTFSGGLCGDADSIVRVGDGRFSVAYTYKPRNNPW